MLKQLFSHVILHVTNRCTLRCKTCFVHKGGEDLSLDNAKTIANKLGKFAWLDIGGGEPFLHDELPELCRLFKSRSLTIPTNGQDADRVESVTRELMKDWGGRLTIGVSLDGPADINDEIRGTGSYDRAIETFHRLRKIDGLELKISTVISNHNWNALIPFMEQIQRMKPDYHSVLLLRGRPTSKDMVLPPLEEIHDRMDAILELLARYDFGHIGANPMGWFKRRYQRYLLHISLRTLAEKRAFVPCKAPLLHKVIYNDGSVTMCELMPPIANIFEDTVPEIERRMRKTLCEYECQRGPCFCTHNCNLGENILSHPPSVLRILFGAF